MKLGSYGVKKPFEEKSQKIEELINNNMRYYPVLRNGKIDEWQAVIK